VTVARSHSLLLTVLALVPALSLAQAPGRGTPSVAATGSEATRGPPPAVAPQSADELADLKVKTLEERVNDLKEKVFRTKARLMSLYLDDYRFEVQSAHVFNAEPGKTTQVKVVGFEKGGITAELKDRPAVRYDVDVRSEDRSQPRPAAAPAGGGW
jgi:hypothetical protein